MKEKNATSIKTIEFIDQQLTSVVDSLSYAEKNLETFRSANKIVNLSEEGSTMFKKLEELQAKKSLIDIKIKYYEYLLKTIRDKSNFKDIITPSIIGVQDQLLNSLVSQLSQLYSERQVLEYTATGDNPSLQIINMKIKNTIAALIDNVNNLIESAQIESKETQKEIAKVDSEIKKLPSTERELINIQRKFELNDNIYNYLLQKRAEVGITKAANLPDLKFIDYALLDNTLLKSPNRKLNYLIALFLGFFLPGLLLIVRDFMNDTIVEREEVERKSNIPILGSVAHNKRINEVLPVKIHPKSSIAESFRAIRTNLSFFINHKSTKHPIISFTSTISGEGKTFCALNLATIIAMNNKKVLVVGLDLRKPKLHTMLKTNISYGITNYLIGTHQIEDILIHTDIQNLDVILSGPIPPNPLELIESEKFAEFVSYIKNLGYDYILFDTPPIGLVADTLSIAKYTDLNVFVMRQNYTNRNAIKFINDIA
ncbi:MAG TPA: polysaccharide biosynthesis tyrosine autokinase, partial [Bacteroidales bacterium]|nr:polysaccharide biosynthesis tyrosine autokinase [Bacteroidales bacterium]